MAGHGIPSNYLGATRLDADANAMLALARAKWHTLSKTQRRALVEASSYGLFGVCLTYATPIATANALTEAGCCGDELARRKLTGLGVMVREAGVYTREQPG